MKNVLVFCFVVLGFTSVYSQNKVSDSARRSIQPGYSNSPREGNKTYSYTVDDPKFPYNLSSWLSWQIHYPEEARREKIEGDVYVRFNIGEDGSVSHIKVVKGIKDGEMLEKEAKRLVSIMPKWTPGYDNNKPASKQVTIRISFILKDDTIAKTPPIIIDTTHEERPQFPGDFESWASHNLIYPNEARARKIEGRVYISFVVEKDGSISNVNILKGADESLDREAVRLVSSMPKWIPGKINGNPSRFNYTMPVGFLLSANPFNR